MNHQLIELELAIRIDAVNRFVRLVAFFHRGPVHQPVMKQPLTALIYSGVADLQEIPDLPFGDVLDDLVGVHRRFGQDTQDNQVDGRHHGFNKLIALSYIAQYTIV